MEEEKKKSLMSKSSTSEMPFYKDNDELKSLLYCETKAKNTKYSAADICFICSMTGSMEKYISVIKETLIDFTKNVHDTINTYPRIAFIGFRDKKDAKQIELKDFTINSEEIVEFIKQIKCSGGSDTCGDIVTPLRKALTLDWRSDLLYVYLIVDAPPHGRSYHDQSVPDKYPDDDKDKLLEKLAFHYMKSKINLVIVKFNKSIDIMVNKIRENYDTTFNRLIVVNLENIKDLKRNFAEHFEHSIASIENLFDEFSFCSRYKNFREVTCKAKSPIPIEGELENSFGQTFKGIVHTGLIKDLNFEVRKYNFKTDLTKTDKLKCTISTSRIGFGMFAEYYPLIIDNNKNYIAKLPKVRVKSVNDLKPEIELNVLARFLADKFNFYLKNSKVSEENVVDKETKPLIEVIPLIIVENATPESFERTKAFLAQKYLEGEYYKYNNNYGWRRYSVEILDLIAQAFSHFTYEFSAGTMIVVDIQGIVNETSVITITDPAIHSALYKGSFGDTNHGQIGILRFFQTHKCNKFCEKLYLSEVSTIKSNMISKAKTEHEEVKNLDHLYKDFESYFEVWRKKIQNFDPSIEPIINSMEGGDDEVNSDSEG